MKNLKTLFKNIGANATTTAAITLFQIASVPIFLKCWGTSLYGEWIALNTLTSYFQITDVGLTTATANELTFCHAKGEYDRCNALISNNAAFVVGAFFVLLLAVLGLSGLGIFAKFFRFKIISPAALSVCLLLLLAQVFIGTLTNLLSSIYRATDTFARGAMVDNAIRASEYIGLLGGVFARLTVPQVLSIGVSIKLVGIVLKYRDSQRQFHFTLHPKYLRYEELKSLWLPSGAFFLFPLSASLALVAPVALVNFFLGSTAVVVFNTTRTMVNFGRSMIDILQRSVWPQLSLAHGRSDAHSMRWFHRITLLSGVAVALTWGVLLMLFGQRVYTLWTAGRAHFDPTLTYCFLAALVTTTLWSSSGVVLQSTNNHKTLSFLYLCSAVLVLGLSYGILRYTGDMNVLPLALLAGDILMISYVIKRALSLTGDSLKGVQVGVVVHARAAVANIIKSFV